MGTITVNTAERAFAHRGAELAGNWFVTLLGWFHKAGQKRAPVNTLARRIREAAEVRAMAQQMLAQDPRFASDLFAAADRHELG